MIRTMLSRLLAISAVAIGLSGCAYYDDGYGRPGYAGGGYYPAYGYGGTAVLYGPGYRPAYDHHDHHAHQPPPRPHPGGWGGGQHDGHHDARRERFQHASGG